MLGTPRALQLACHVYAFGAITLIASAAEVASAGSPTLEAPVYGALTCASSSCHGGATEQGRQYILWSQRDVHSRAYATLTTARAARMGEALGIANPTKSTHCTACHAPLHTVEPQLLAADANASEGVSCVSCHGPADGGWLRSHTRTDYTHADRVAAGMRDLRDLSARADACVACHQNIAPEIVQAGKHPALLFELDGQAHTEPKHWREPAGFDGAQAWYVGQAVALREMSWALLHGTIDAPRERPRWAALQWLMQHVQREDSLTARPLAAPSPSADELRRTQENAEQLARRAAQTWTTESRTALLQRLTATAPEFGIPKITREAALALACRAERLVIALDRLLAAGPPSAKEKHKAASAQLDRLFALVQSQPDFSPPDFARELQAFGEKLK